MVAGLWLLLLGRVWYNLPVLFPGLFTFFSPAAWVTQIPGFQEGSKVLGSVEPLATAPHLTPRSGDLQALGRGLNGTEGGVSFNQN